MDMETGFEEKQKIINGKIQKTQSKPPSETRAY